MKRTTLFAIVAFGIAAMLMVATPSMAVHKNYDGKLACGSCHTMHNSQGGDTSNLGGNSGGTIVLLRGAFSGREDIHNLCLECHASNGAQKDQTFGNDNHPAPKVYINGAGGTGNGFDGTNFDQIGAGGDFSNELDSSWVDNGAGVGLGYGHSLGLTDVTPPGQADGNITGFSCTSCHDPHGAYTGATTSVNWFRNLRINPADSGDSVTLNTNTASYVGMNDGTDSNFMPAANAVPSTTIWPFIDQSGSESTSTCEVGQGIDNAAANGAVNCYAVTGGTNATDGIANWCAACHDNWHEEGDTRNTDDTLGDWKRHPVDVEITGGANGYGVSGSGTSIITGALPNYALVAAVAKLPVAKTGTSGATGYSALMVGAATVASAESDRSKVFCLSCHFAHAGPYYDSLRWDYLSAVSLSSQDANSVDTSTGCQLCHNK